MMLWPFKVLWYKTTTNLHMDISETFIANASLAYDNGHVVWHNDTQKLIIRDT